MGLLNFIIPPSLHIKWADGIGAKPKRKTFFVMFLVLISLLFLQISDVHSDEYMPLLTLNDSNKAPFTTKQRDGFMDIILIEAFKRIGYKVKTVQLPPERGLLSANAGILDGEVNRIAGLQAIYPNLRKVPEKIRDSEFCALSRDPTIINTPEELNKKIVGHLKGWKIFDKMMANSHNVITATTPRQLFRLLENKRVDVILYTCAEGFELVNKLKLRNIHKIKPNFTQAPLFIYLNKRHGSLVQALSEAIKEIKTEGIYDQLYQEKIYPYYKFQEVSL